MVTEVTKSCEKVALKFVCKNCHYETSKKSSYDKHLLTVKHSVSLAGDIGDATCDIKVAKSCLLICEKCNKSYNSRNGLFPKYKANRANGKEDGFMGGPFFKMAYEEELFIKGGAQSIFVLISSF